MIADKAEFILSTRQMRPVEQRRIEENQPKDLLPYSRAYVLVLDALVPVTMLSHLACRISLSALAAVFSGEISNQKDLGEREAPIIPNLWDPRSGVAQAVTDRVLQPVDQVMSSAG